MSVTVRIFFVVLSYISLVIVAYDALIPKACANNILGEYSVCCPVPRGFQRACGGLGRGSCVRLWPPSESISREYSSDDRILWPLRFFRFACHCEGNFFGPACEECWYGWSGVDCNIPDVRIRKNMLSLSKNERQMFQKVVTLSTKIASNYLIFEERENWKLDPMRTPAKFLEVSVYQQIVFTHRFASRGTLFDDQERCETVDPLNFNHNGCGFLTWHRYFMLFWERELQKIARQLGDNTFALPYWDWLDLKTCDICTNDLIGESGSSGTDGIRLSVQSPFYNFDDYCSSPDEDSECLGCHSSNRFAKISRAWTNFNFPTSNDLKYVLSKRKYYDNPNDDSQCSSFERSVEGFCGPRSNMNPLLYMHNRIHNMVNGTFSNSPTSVNDPIFIVHHTFVDKIFQAWYNKYHPVPQEMWNQTGCAPGQCAQCNMVGFIPTVAHWEMFTDTKTLGYTYDNIKFGK